MTRGANDGGGHDAPDKDSDAAALAALAVQIKAWGREQGLGAVAIAALDMREPARRLDAWLAEGRHGEMDYMARHAALRADPAQLLPASAGEAGELSQGFAKASFAPPEPRARASAPSLPGRGAGKHAFDLRAIVARIDYRPRTDDEDWIDREGSRQCSRDAAVVSLYARGRDYHKVLRDRLQKLATRIEQAIGPYRYRVCTDTAPVFEVEAARRAGIGWRGKHTLLLSREAGSMFFLGEILTDLALPVDASADDHCGTCTRCIEACPTQAITAPYQLDARRCISYLTIEHRSAIPESLRAAIGNRVYGCDDCQLACPWNKYAQVATVPDFDVRNGLDRATLVELFAWSEADFRTRHAGSAILRIGYERWLRNLAVGLGNAATSDEVVHALRKRADHPSALVREHVAWALARHRG